MLNLSLLADNCISEVPRLDEVCFFVPKKGWGILDDDNYSRDVQLRDYKKWEIEMMDKPNAVRTEDIRENPQDYIFRCDFYELKFLFDVQPPKGSIYIRSVTEPVDEEMEIEKVKADNWLKYFDLYPYEQIHCSGHTSGLEIKEMIEKIAPNTLIPIHTEDPTIFKDFDANIVIKNLGEKYKLS